jgi:CheY-like chemotaxis protein
MKMAWCAERTLVAAGQPLPDRSRPSAASASAFDLSRSRWFPARRSEPRLGLPKLTGRTILVVDDDPDALDLMHMILESCGARVLAASTAMHARGYLQNVTPDLIVCDLALPREDGPSFVHTVRTSKNAALARVPAVAITAFYEDYPPTRAVEFAAYFQKPIDIDALTQTLASILRSDH